jgi:hypothetical protein
MKRSFILAHSTARRNALACVAEAPDGYCVIVQPKSRSLEQNARMWAMLGEVSRQVDWYGKKLSPEAWKCVFSASLKKQDVVPGLHGDFVVIGQSTSSMGIGEMNDLMTLMESFGVERGVRFEAEHA